MATSLSTTLGKLHSDATPENTRHWFKFEQIAGENTTRNVKQ